MGEASNSEDRELSVFFLSCKFSPQPLSVFANTADICIEVQCLHFAKAFRKTIELSQMSSDILLIIIIHERSHVLISQAVALYPAEEESSIVFQLKWSPITGELIIAPKAFPLELVVLDTVLRFTA